VLTANYSVKLSKKMITLTLTFRSFMHSGLSALFALPNVRISDLIYSNYNLYSARCAACKRSRMSTKATSLVHVPCFDSMGE